MNKDPRENFEVPAAVTPEEPQTLDVKTEVFRLLDKRLDLAAFVSHNRQYFKAGKDFKVTDNITIAGQAFKIILTSAAVDKFQPVISLETINESGQLEVMATYALSGRFKQGIAAVLAGQTLEKTRAEAPFDGEILEVAAHRSVPDFASLERALYHERPPQLYLVSSAAKGSTKIYRVEPNPVRGHRFFTFNLKTNTWSKTGQALSSLATVANNGLTFLTSEVVAEITSRTDSIRIKPVLKTSVIENDVAPEAEVRLLSPKEMAQLMSESENLENWECVFDAITRKSTSATVERNGVKMRIDPSNDGKKATLSFEVAGDDSALWQKMKAEKAAALENEKTKAALVRFLKAYGVKGFGFKGRIKTEVEPEESNSDQPEADGVSRTDMMDLMGKMGAAGGGVESSDPENTETKASQCVAAFIAKFNAEVLRDVKGKIKRADRSEGTAAALEGFDLLAEDLVIESESGLVFIDLNEIGQSKVRNFWFGSAFGKGTEVKIGWYQFKANLANFVSEQAKLGVEVDLTSFITAVDDLDL